jgi:hypothetical protein
VKLQNLYKIFSVTISHYESLWYFSVRRTDFEEVWKEVKKQIVISNLTEEQRPRVGGIFLLVDTQSGNLHRLLFIF